MIYTVDLGTMPQQQVHLDMVVATMEVPAIVQIVTAIPPALVMDLVAIAARLVLAIVQIVTAIPPTLVMDLQGHPITLGIALRLMDLGITLLAQAMTLITTINLKEVFLPL